MSNILLNPNFQVMDANGDPVSGAKAYVYLTGTTTETDSYSDNDLTTPHANPVIADSTGAFSTLYLDPSIVYKIVLTDASDVTIRTYDPVSSSFGGPSSATDNAIPKFDGTSGTKLQNSGVTIDDNNKLSAAAIVTPLSGTLTIASGVVTVTSGYHLADTESAASTDDLDTINGGADGQLLMIRAASDARTVVAKDGTGNLVLAGDFSLDNSADALTLIYNQSGNLWHEISRSDNGS